MDNAGKLIEQMDITVSIWCDKCDETAEGYDADYLAERLDRDGWTVTRSNRVLCPNCRPKRRKHDP